MEERTIPVKHLDHHADLVYSPDDGGWYFDPLDDEDYSADDSGLYATSNAAETGFRRFVEKLIPKAER
jgi:hypothetical protein